MLFDVSNPVNPQRVGSYTASGSRISAVALSGHYAYLAESFERGRPLSGLEVIDVSNPANPQRVGGYATSGGVYPAVAVSGHYAYVARFDGGGLVIDISNPAHPQQAGGYATSRFANDMVVSGNHAYVADSSGLQVIDVIARPIRSGWVALTPALP